MTFDAATLTLTQGITDTADTVAIIITIAFLQQQPPPLLPQLLQLRLGLPPPALVPQPALPALLDLADLPPLGPPLQHGVQSLLRRGEQPAQGLHDAFPAAAHVRQAVGLLFLRQGRRAAHPRPSHLVYVYVSASALGPIEIRRPNRTGG
jgi:hypothetical protein